MGAISNVLPAGAISNPYRDACAAACAFSNIEGLRDAFPMYDAGGPLDNAAVK